MKTVIKVAKTLDACSCNECHRPNYAFALGNMEQVDELFDVQIGAHVTTLCADCIERLGDRLFVFFYGEYGENKENDSGLKRCPFCGGNAIIDDCGDNRYFVRCERCKVAQDYLYRTKKSASSAWNRRHTDGVERNRL